MNDDNEVEGFEAPRDWHAFGAWFVATGEERGWFPRIPHYQAPRECSWLLGATVEETAHTYYQAEVKFQGEIEIAILRRAHSLTLSKSLLYFLGLRIAVLDRFFLKFSMSLSQSPNSGLVVSIIPFPSLAPHQVMQWFLLTWWRQWGRFEVATLHHLQTL
jgi:hypothetical protein